MYEHTKSEIKNKRDIKMKLCSSIIGVLMLIIMALAYSEGNQIQQKISTPKNTFSQDIIPPHPIVAKADGLRVYIPLQFE